MVNVKGIWSDTYKLYQFYQQHKDAKLFTQEAGKIWDKYADPENRPVCESLLIALASVINVEHEEIRQTMRKRAEIGRR